MFKMFMFAFLYYCTKKSLCKAEVKSQPDIRKHQKIVDIFKIDVNN